jgi:arginase
VETVVAAAVAVVSRGELSGFWLHLDADLLDDTVMPAVEYRQPGAFLRRTLSRSCGRAAEALRALSVANYNAAMDPSEDAGRQLVECLGNGLA